MPDFLGRSDYLGQTDWIRTWAEELCLKPMSAAYQKIILEFVCEYSIVTKSEHLK